MAELSVQKLGKKLDNFQRVCAGGYTINSCGILSSRNPLEFILNYGEVNKNA